MKRKVYVVEVHVWYMAYWVGGLEKMRGCEIWWMDVPTVFQKIRIVFAI